MRQTIRKLSVLLIVLLLTITISTSGLAAPVTEEQATAASQLAELEYLSLLLQNYSIEYGESATTPLQDVLMDLLIENPTLYEKLIEDMFGRLDKYSHYLSANDYTVGYPASEPYVGIGISADASYPYGLVVKDFVDGGAAGESGMKVGDVVLSVDGVDVSLLYYGEANALIRGEEGTDVTLTVQRDGSWEPLSFTMTRKSLSTNNVSYENLGGGVGMITISRFGEMADIIAFIDIWRSIPYDDDIKSVIIDLRNNPGGDVNVLFHIMNNMVYGTKGIMFALTDHVTSDFYTSEGIGVWQPNQLILLVNENSASCTEIMAGSLQQLGMATVVGTTTYGKARSQYHLPTTNSSVAVVTAYDVLLPDGETYEGVGIIPDVMVNQEEQLYPMSALAPLSGVIGYGTTSGDVKALEERLALLGIFPGTPDEKFDPATRWSLNVLQKACDLELSSYADAETLAMIDTLLADLSKTTITIDKQLEPALDLAKVSAGDPLKVPLQDKSNWMALDWDD